MKKILLLSTLFFLGLSTYSDNPPCNLTDKGVLINGIRWATRNVDAPGTFAETPESPGMFFQWNRRKGWNAVDRYVEGWDSSVPEGTKWYAENDPCPEGWRVPTADEFISLIEATTGVEFNSDAHWAHDFLYHSITNWQNTGVTGMIFGRALNQFFLPVSCERNFNDGTLGGSIPCGNFYPSGIYWSSTQGQDNTRFAWRLLFHSGQAGGGNVIRTFGYNIRCVAK